MSVNSEMSFWCLQFPPKKRTKKFDFNFLSFFWRLKTPKKYFEIKWPLVQHYCDSLHTCLFGTSFTRAIKRLLDQLFLSVLIQVNTSPKQKWFLNTYFCQLCFDELQKCGHANIAITFVYQLLNISYTLSAKASFTFKGINRL